MFEKIIGFFRFLKYNIVPERIEMKAKKIAMTGANEAFRFFKDEKFRELIKFVDLMEEEQNRIFNELTVTNLVLTILLLEQIAREEENTDRKKYLQAIRETLPEYFINFLKGLGIDARFVEIWRKLIDLRYDEYAKDMVRFRGEMLAQNEKDLSVFINDNSLMIFQTMVFGLYDHLTRSRIKKADPLYLYLQPYFLKVYKGIVKKI